MKKRHVITITLTSLFVAAVAWYFWNPAIVRPVLGADESLDCVELSSPAYGLAELFREIAPDSNGDIDGESRRLCPRKDGNASSVSDDNEVCDRVVLFQEKIHAADRVSSADVSAAWELIEKLNEAGDYNAVVTLSYVMAYKLEEQQQSGLADEFSASAKGHLGNVSCGRQRDCYSVAAAAGEYFWKLENYELARKLFAVASGYLNDWASKGLLYDRLATLHDRANLLRWEAVYWRKAAQAYVQVDQDVDAADRYHIAGATLLKFIQSGPVFTRCYGDAVAMSFYEADRLYGKHLARTDDIWERLKIFLLRNGARRLGKGWTAQ